MDHENKTNQNNDKCTTDNPSSIPPPTSQSSDITDHKKQSSAIGISDEEFASWLMDEIKDVPGRNKYDKVFTDAVNAIVRWRIRYRGNPKLWRRLFRSDKIIKELVESAPIMEAVRKIVHHSSEHDDEQRKKFTIVDLASGKGYLSMFLSEMLPPDRVERFVCIDKAWPMHNDSAGELKPTQISREHLAGSYFTSWPIPIHTSKQDLKAGRAKRQLQKVLFDREGTFSSSGERSFIFLAIHLCGTLSIKAVNLFNYFQDEIKFLALKPCCLPNMIHAKRKETFKIGSHSFPASDVCAPGSFHKNEWSGPPRGHLRGRFHRWSDHLLRGTELCKIIDDDGEDGNKISDDNEGVDVGASEMSSNIDKIEDHDHNTNRDTSNGRKKKHFVYVQENGGYQNTYIYAERNPLTLNLWKELDRDEEERKVNS